MLVRGREGRAKVKVTAIQTGTANLHHLHEEAPLQWKPLRRKVGIMLDREWVGPVPIYSYLIEHPEGLSVVDTGNNARNSRKDYMPKTNPFFQYAVRINVAPEEEIGVRLTDMGIDPARDVRQLWMTHLHHDHTGGLHHFPHTDALASEDCLRAARRQHGLIGALPRSFDPRPFKFDAVPVGPFTRSARLTSDGSILVVDIPGHIAAQVAIIVQTSLASQRAVKAFARNEPSVLLLGHDPGVPERLSNKQVLATFVMGAPRSCAVGVVVVPPPVGSRLRVVLGRVLPILLAAERGHVQVAPGGAHGLVASAVDEIGAVDPVTLADKRVVPVPLVDAEVPVPVVGDRVPGDVLPPVALL